jgi:hypothetical protein
VNPSVSAPHYSFEFGSPLDTDFAANRMPLYILPKEKRLKIVFFQKIFSKWSPSLKNEMFYC